MIHFMFHFAVVVFEVFAGVLMALLVHGAIRGKGKR